MIISKNDVKRNIWALSVANMDTISEMLRLLDDDDDASVQKFDCAFYAFMKACNVFYSENIFKEA